MKISWSLCASTLFLTTYPMLCMHDTTPATVPFIAKRTDRYRRLTLDAKHNAALAAAAKQSYEEALRNHQIETVRAKLVALAINSINPPHRALLEIDIEAKNQ